LASTSGSNVTVNLHRDYETGVIGLTGAGTEELVLREMVYLENDVKSTTVHGIRSDLSEGPNTLFINHQGGADSVHVGDFYVRSMMSADVVQVHDQLIVNNTQTKIVDGIMYVRDNSRGKWLSVFRPTFTWSYNGVLTTDAIMRMAGSAQDGAQFIGYPLTRDCTITDIFIGARECTVAVAPFNLYSGVYGGAKDDTVIDSFELPVGTGADNPVMYKEVMDLDVDADNYLAMRYIPASGSSVENPYMTIEVAWRLDE
jgi:hypothetical protein